MSGIVDVTLRTPRKPTFAQRLYLPEILAGMRVTIRHFLRNLVAIRRLPTILYPEEKRDKCLALVAGLPRLAVTPEVIDLVAYYVREHLMPADDLGDAFHLALATWYRIQYLLTWNCKHLANANKFDHVQVLNGRRRLVSPALITPAQLLEIEP